MSGKSKSNKNKNKTYRPKGSVKKTSTIKNSQQPKQEENPNKEESQIKETKTKTITTTNTGSNTHTQTATNHATQNSQSAESSSTEDTQSSNAKQSNAKSNTGARKNPPMSEKKRHGVAALCLIGGSIVVGIVATILGGHLDESYIKPQGYPPEWLFPVVWTILYISIGIAAYIAYVAVQDMQKRRGDVIWFAVHMFLNFMWPLFYFTLNWLIFSCVWLVFVVATAIVVTYRFYRANLASGIIFTLYTLWLLYALYLSLGITILNV